VSESNSNIGGNNSQTSQGGNDGVRIIPPTGNGDMGSWTITLALLGFSMMLIGVGLRKHRRVRPERY
jgi:hypothetical protein